MITFLITFWFLRQIKSLLFWVFLWQLKEYQVRRFLDYFRTTRGKDAVLNKLNYLKIGLFLVFFFFLFFGRNMGADVFLPFCFWILIVLYVIELSFAVKSIFQRRLLKPVFTKKTIVLLAAGIILNIIVFSLLFSFIKDIFLLAFLLLSFDILSLIIYSGLVLAFQPFAVFFRNQIIKKAKIKRDSFKNLLVIGITGSYGKTSTKEFLGTILSEKFNVLKTREHQNSEVGISQCILKDLKPEHEVFIVEMGAYARGGIKLLAGIAKPKIGILTGINEQHIALFGSQQNIVNTKYELIESLPQEGTAVFNADNPWCLELYKKTTIPKRLYKIDRGVSEAGLLPDIFAEQVLIEKNHLSFKATHRDGDSCDFKINALGSQNIQNILGAILVAKELGMSLKEISRACLKIKQEQGAMKLIKGKIGKIDIIDSSYSANPDGVVSAIEHLKLWRARRFIVMPSLIELGRASKEIHFRIGVKIGEICDAAIITTRDYFKDIQEGAERTGMDRSRILFIENPLKIANQLEALCGIDDVVLLEGRIPDKLIDILTRSF